MVSACLVPSAGGDGDGQEVGRQIEDQGSQHEGPGARPGCWACAGGGARRSAGSGGVPAGGISTSRLQSWQRARPSWRAVADRFHVGGSRRSQRRGGSRLEKAAAMTTIKRGEAEKTEMPGYNGCHVAELDQGDQDADHEHLHHAPGRGLLHQAKNVYRHRCRATGPLQRREDVEQARSSAPMARATQVKRTSVARPYSPCRQSS